jgi:hypothetical protein
MLIKQKLKIYEKQKMQSISSNPQAPHHEGQAREMEQEMSKLEWYMENYLWKYVDKLDGKIEEVSDKIMNQVDKIVIGEIPSQFELEDENEHEENDPNIGSAERVQANYQAIGEGNDDDDLMRRLEEEIGEGGEVPNSNLLEFEEVEDESPKKEEPKESQH